MMRSLLCGLCLLAAGCSMTDDREAVREESEPRWPVYAREVEIVSSVDREVQRAMFYAPGDAVSAVPLLVLLHTWSGDWRQPMGIDWLEEARSRGWAFIHPDFRGANGRPESTGSRIATADILDAVEFARRRADIDPGRIYLAGTSGGGHMALLTAGREPAVWAGVSAWVPIFDLARWHAECEDRELKYAAEMETACGGPPGASPAVDTQYALRSPRSALSGAAGLAVDINTGIDDGHDGSVPVGHSLRAFNLLARANGADSSLIGDDHIDNFERRRAVPPALAGERQNDPAYGDRTVLFRRRAGPARVTVFDGGHEGIPAAGVSWLAGQRRR